MTLRFFKGHRVATVMAVPVLATIVGVTVALAAGHAGQSVHPSSSQHQPQGTTVSSNTGKSIVAPIDADTYAIPWLPATVLHHLGLTVDAPNAVAGTSAAAAERTAVGSVGGAAVQPAILALVHDYSVYNKPTTCLCWLVEVRPSSGQILSDAPGSDSVLSHVYLVAIDATTGKWQWAYAGGGLP